MSKMLNMLLQRSDSDIPWGFKLTGGREHGTQLTIAQVTRGAVAAQHLSPGDVILSIGGYSGASILLAQAEQLIDHPGNSLELLVKKAAKTTLPISSIWDSYPDKTVRNNEYLGERILPAYRDSASRAKLSTVETPVPRAADCDRNQVYRHFQYGMVNQSVDVDRWKSDGDHCFSGESKTERCVDDGIEHSEKSGTGAGKQSGAQSGGAIPPPPPPPPHPSQLSTRLNSEVGPRVVEPPAAIQSAMLKDKKPFTYTPGGLDLSQIRSPRMQRRISRNAHSEGHVGPHVQQAVAPEATHPGEGASLYVPAVGGVNTEQVAVEPPPPPTPPTPPGTQRGQVGAIYVPPVLPSPEVQRAQLNKAPTPWLSQQPRQASTPPWANRGPEDSRPPAAVPAWSPKPPEDAASWVSRAPEEVKTRTIPIHVEGRDTPHGGARIIPIQMEGAEEKRPVNVESRAESSSADMQREKTFPVQSRSFRVLQKITDTDSVAGESQQPWNQQLRKMQLCDDDRALMDKFKAQVDEENFLHCEADPRYRGAAIPSRAFRMLQTMTDGADYVQVMVPHGPPMRTVPRQEQPAPAELQAQPYIPPSEQQVLEPRKYTGGAIPSRSFRMLQAMTAGPQDSGSGQQNL